MIARLLLMGLLLSGCSSCSVRRAAFTCDADRLAANALRIGPLAGLSVGVLSHGQTLLLTGYGLADRERRVPAGADTIYRLASMSKQFTAACTLQLAEQGRVHLQDDIAQYVPDYPTHGQHITIEQLLRHISGIPNYTEMGMEVPAGGPSPSPQARLALFSQRPLDFPPGERWHYSNSGYLLLGMIVEKVSGHSYPDYLRDHVLEPLHLHSTSFCECAATGAHHAEGYAVERGKLARQGTTRWSCAYADGGICSNVPDLLAWERALEGGRVISPASYRLMSSSAPLPGGQDPHYGYGLFVEELKGHRRLDHGGAMVGYRTKLSRYPDDDLTIVVMSNTMSEVPLHLEDKLRTVIFTRDTAVYVAFLVLYALQVLLVAILPYAALLLGASALHRRLRGRPLPLFSAPALLPLLLIVAGAVVLATFGILVC